MNIRQTLGKIVSVLDGQPTGLRGQSLVEMALTTPMLLLMILGLTEIGFLANNYMILMDAVRVGGRDAVTMKPSAPDFPVRGSLQNAAQYDGARNRSRMGCSPYDLQQKHYDGLIPGNTTNGYRFIDSIPHPPFPANYYRGDWYNAALVGGNDLTANAYGYYIGPIDGSFKFFDEIACQVSNAMNPLLFNDDDSQTATFLSQDDIVVSAISFDKIDYTSVVAAGRQNAGVGGCYNGCAMYPTGPQSLGNSWVTVTGRWPIENRFCGYKSGATLVGDYRDPFDYMRNEFDQDWHNGSQANGQTLDQHPSTPFTYEGVPYNSHNDFDSTLGVGYVLDITKANKIDATNINNAFAGGDNQGVRGWVFSGHHRSTGSANSPDDCIGSEFRVQDIEQRLNQDPTWNPLTPNGGMIIVEVFWQHHPLFFGPLFEGFNHKPGNDPVLHVWGMFPLPSTEATETP